MQTILTLLVVSKKGFRLHVIGQFTFYGFYYIGIGVIFLVAVVIDYVREFNSKKFVRE
jgi:solute carrier family 19 (thiamine transporter), member 2/3